MKEALLRFRARREQVNSNAAAAYTEKHDSWEAGGKAGKEPSKPKKIAEAFAFMHCYDVMKNSSVFMRTINSTSAPRKRRRSNAPSIGEQDEGNASDDERAFANLWCTYIILSSIMMVRELTLLCFRCSE